MGLNVDRSLFGGANCVRECIAEVRPENQGCSQIAADESVRDENSGGSTQPINAI